MKNFKYEDDSGGCCGCIILIGGLITLAALIGVLIRVVRWAAGI